MITTKTILVPTDFSRNSTKPLTYAAEVAHREGAALHLLHVIEVASIIQNPFPLHKNVQEEIAKARLADLKTTKQSLAYLYPTLTIKIKLAKGIITSEILNYAEAVQADLIIMGTQGASGLKEVFLGSICGGIIGSTKIPVLAVPFAYPMEKPGAIMFATHRYEEDSELLDKIVEFASLFNAAVHVVVFINIDVSTPEFNIGHLDHLNKYIGFLKQTYPDISFTGEVLKDKEFEETIEEYNTKNKVDILAMITYPKSFWEKLLKKSVTKKMAFHSKIPVLAIPAK